ANVALGRVWYDGSISGDEVDLISFRVKVKDANFVNIELTSPELRDGSGKLYRMPVNLPELSTLPSKFELIGNYPNPFNPSTVIKFNLAKSTNVSLKIYNTLGQLVEVLMNNETLEAGRHEKVFDASKLTSGVYFYKLETPEFTAIKKMVLMK
ncbi:MAG: T9SS type A sorting domain-containing protein, partial [Ignavibacteria bacterium]|nr:T9SS type A sorting domain-containing protein [Ignavibacteria bacterium]